MRVEVGTEKATVDVGNVAYMHMVEGIIGVIDLVSHLDLQRNEVETQRANSHNTA